MKIKFLNLLLIGSIVLSGILGSCKKNEENNSSNNNSTLETGTFTDSRDNKTYNWVKIGEQVWMAENLNYTGSGTHITDDAEWDNNSDYDGWCYYENNESYSNTYGVLYQWEVAKVACPTGWHLPTDEEWTQLENYLKENAYSYDGVVGNKYIAKSLATANGWSISENQGAVGNSDFPAFRNKTGFSALPSGRRGGLGGNHYFEDLGDVSFWWSATEGNIDFAYFCDLHYNNAEVKHDATNKSVGFSVRCVRD